MQGTAGARSTSSLLDTLQVYSFYKLTLAHENEGLSVAGLFPDSCQIACEAFSPASVPKLHYGSNDKLAAVLSKEGKCYFQTRVSQGCSANSDHP